MSSVTLGIWKSLKFVVWERVKLTKLVFRLDTYLLYPLPNDKIFDLTKLKAFADDKLNIVKMMIFLYNRVENTEEKGDVKMMNSLYNRVENTEEKGENSGFPKTSTLGS